MVGMEINYSASYDTFDSAQKYDFYSCDGWIRHHSRYGHVGATAIPLIIQIPMFIRPVAIPLQSAAQIAAFTKTEYIVEIEVRPPSFSYWPSICKSEFV